MGRLVKSLFIVTGLVAWVVNPAWAAILDFGMIAPTPGTISYAGGAAPLVGTDIEVDNVAGLGGTPLNNNVLRNLSPGDLDFTTGNWISTVGPVSSFAGGGSITLVGGVDLNNDGDFTDVGDIPVGTTLFSGSWTSPVTITNLSGTSKIFGAAFADEKNAQLAAFYGLAGGPGNPWVGAINLSFAAATPGGTPPSAFSTAPNGQVLSGDITNEPFIPEPASLLLFGIGALGAIGIRTRRSVKA